MRRTAWFGWPRSCGPQAAPKRPRPSSTNSPREGPAEPDQSEAEDAIEDIEDDPEHPGKIIQVNDDDTDSDGIPDYADGFDQDNGGDNTDDDVTTWEKFIPLKLDLSPGLAVYPNILTEGTVTFSYSASSPHPDDLTYNAETGAYTLPNDGATPPKTYKLRLWKVDGSEARNKASLATDPTGDFIPSGEDISLCDLGGLGEITLYVIVTERPFVISVDFEGNQKIKTPDHKDNLDELGVTSCGACANSY